MRLQGRKLQVMVTRPLTHSQVLQASLAVERYNTWHSSGKGGDRELATIAAAIAATTLHLPPRQLTPSHPLGVQKQKQGLRMRKVGILTDQHIKDRQDGSPTSCRDTVMLNVLGSGQKPMPATSPASGTIPWASIPLPSKFNCFVSFRPKPNSFGTRKGTY